MSLNGEETRVLSLHASEVGSDWALSLSLAQQQKLVRHARGTQSHGVLNFFHSVGFKFFIGNVHIFVVIDRNV